MYFALNHKICSQIMYKFSLSANQNRVAFLGVIIHITTLYNVCAVPWGVLSIVGVFSTVGGYHEYRGGIS